MTYSWYLSPCDHGICLYHLGVLVGKNTHTQTQNNNKIKQKHKQKILMPGFNLLTNTIKLSFFSCCWGYRDPFSLAYFLISSISGVFLALEKISLSSLFLPSKGFTSLTVLKFLQNIGKEILTLSSYSFSLHKHLWLSACLLACNEGLEKERKHISQ